jgi:hypothetical protein
MFTKAKLRDCPSARLAQAKYPLLVELVKTPTRGRFIYWNVGWTVARITDEGIYNVGTFSTLHGAVFAAKK